MKISSYSFLNNSARIFKNIFDIQKDRYDLLNLKLKKEVFKPKLVIKNLSKVMQHRAEEKRERTKYEEK
ncbi:MAG: hypothetical protein ACJAXF_000112 [Polaribacter sp.]|jgi:hypothetical protein